MWEGEKARVTECVAVRKRLTNVDSLIFTPWSSHLRIFHGLTNLARSQKVTILSLGMITEEDIKGINMMNIVNP